MKPTFHKRLGGARVCVTRVFILHIYTCSRRIYVCVWEHTSVTSDVMLVDA